MLVISPQSVTGNCWNNNYTHTDSAGRILGLCFQYNYISEAIIVKAFLFFPVLMLTNRGKCGISPTVFIKEEWWGYVSKIHYFTYYPKQALTKCCSSALINVDRRITYNMWCTWPNRTDGHIWWYWKVTQNAANLCKLVWCLCIVLFCMNTNYPNSLLHLLLCALSVICIYSTYALLW